MARKTNKQYTEYFLVGATGQAVKQAGNLINTDNSVNLNNGQLGMIAAIREGSLTPGDFLTGGETIANISEVKIVQGTPNASDNSGVYGWHYEDKGWVESPIIRANSIQSYSARISPIDSHSAVLYTGLPAPADSTRYALHTTLRSVRKDRDYGGNVDTITVDYRTGDLSTVTDDRDFLIQQLGYKLNLQSKLANFQPDWHLGGNKEVLVLALNTGGSTWGGTDLSTLAVGDTIPVQTDGTTTLNVTVTKALLETLHNAYSASSSLDTSTTIETFNLTEAGKGLKAQGTFTVTSNTNIATDTVTIGSTALVEGTDFDAGSDDTAAQLAVTATNLAAAITAAGEDVTATASGAVVTVVADAYGVSGNSIVWTYTDQGSAGGTISGSGTLTGGASTNVDAFMVIGLEQRLSQAFDDIYARKVTIDTEFGYTTATDVTAFTDFDQFLATKLIASRATERDGSGRLFRIWYDTRAYAQTGSQQLTGHADEVLRAPSYIDESTNYTAYVIDCYNEDVVNNDHIHNQTRIWILLPCDDDDNSATVASGLTVTTTDDNSRLSDLNSIFGVWLKSNDTFEINGIPGSDLFI